jgi:hypothetical protein
MTKRRVASILVYKNNRALKYPAKVTTVVSGTGTATSAGIYTVVAATGVYVATRCYLTLTDKTNKGTLVGSA